MKFRSFDTGMKLIVLSFLVVFIGACSDGKAKQSMQRVVPVKIGDVIQQNVPLQIDAIGNVEAYNTVSVKAMIGGEVIGVHFKEGQDVRQGDLLFQIDPRPYDAALKQAEGALARDVAQAKNAEEQAKRYEILVQKDYVSKDQYDQLRANADALAAAPPARGAPADHGQVRVRAGHSPPPARRGRGQAAGTGGRRP